MSERSTIRDRGLLHRRTAAQAVAELSPTPPFPGQLMIELSNACNHACSFCYNSRMRRRRGNADDALVRRILAEAHALGAREVGFATTGDALVHENLFDHVTTAKRTGYEHTSFSTNGALLTPALVEQVLDSGLDSIEFSINAGRAATYARVHGSDQFDHVVAMVRLLDERRRVTGRPLELLVTSILTPDTADEQPFLREALGEVVDDVAFLPALGAVGPTNGSHAPPPCAQIFNRAHVTWEGYLTACCGDYENNLVVADLASTPLADAWQAPAFQELRRWHLDGRIAGTVCRVCITRQEAPYHALTDIGRAVASVKVSAYAPAALPGSTAAALPTPALATAVTPTSAATVTPASAALWTPASTATVTPASAALSVPISAATVTPTTPALGQPRRHILVLFTGSIGAVDWLLPVLRRLREQAPSTQILALIGDPQLQAELQRADFFRTRLEQVAEIHHHGRDRLSDHYRAEDIGLILKSDDPDDALSRVYRRRLPGVPVVSFPGGNAIRTHIEDSEARIRGYFAALTDRTGRDPRANYLPVSLCLATSPHVVPYYRHVMPNTEIRVVGSPRYDPRWVAELLADQTLANGPEADFARRHATTVLFAPRGPDWLYLDRKDHDELLIGFATALSRWPNVGALVKPHPRQDPAELARWLRAAGARRTLVTHRPLLQLASLADLTVSMFSSGVLDSLRVGTPTVEYYRYHARQPVLEFRRAADGRMISIYEQLGLVENVGDITGLTHALERAHAGDPIDDAELSLHVERARRAARWGDDRAGAAATVLLEVLSRARERRPSAVQHEVAAMATAARPHREAIHA